MRRLLACRAPPHLLISDGNIANPRAPPGSASPGGFQWIDTKANRIADYLSRFKPLKECPMTEVLPFGCIVILTGTCFKEGAELEVSTSLDADTNCYVGQVVDGNKWLLPRHIEAVPGYLDTARQTDEVWKGDKKREVSLPGLTPFLAALKAGYIRNWPPSTHDWHSYIRGMRQRTNNRG